MTRIALLILYKAVKKPAFKSPIHKIIAILSGNETDLTLYIPDLVCTLIIFLEPCILTWYI